MMDGWNFTERALGFRTRTLESVLSSCTAPLYSSITMSSLLKPLPSDAVAGTTSLTSSSIPRSMKFIRFATGASELEL